MARVYLSKLTQSRQKVRGKVTGCLLLICLLAACAIPLRQSPEPVPHAASESDTSADLQLERRQDGEAAAVAATPGNVDEGQDITTAANSADAEVVANAVDDADSESELSTLAQATVSSDSVSSTSGDADASMAPLVMATIAVEQLDLAAQEQTFLDAVSAKRRELSVVDSHRYVEVTDDGGTIWQGELLQGAGETVVLMQPQQSGGQSAVQLSFPAGPEFSVDDLLADLSATLSAVETPESRPDEFGLPDVDIQFVRARETAAGIWNFDVRLNHPDTGWEDYTDGWHVETLGGEILGVRILAHPHVNEMPFTRSQGGIEIPEGVTEIQVRSHDLVSGYSAETVVVPIGESGSGEKYEVVK